MPAHRRFLDMHRLLTTLLVTPPIMLFRQWLDDGMPLFGFGVDSSSTRGVFSCIISVNHCHSGHSTAVVLAVLSIPELVGIP